MREAASSQPRALNSHLLRQPAEIPPACSAPPASHRPAVARSSIEPTAASVEMPRRDWFASSRFLLTPKTGDSAQQPNPRPRICALFGKVLRNTREDQCPHAHLIPVRGLLLACTALNDFAEKRPLPTSGYSAVSINGAVFTKVAKTWLMSPRRFPLPDPVPPGS